MHQHTPGIGEGVRVKMEEGEGAMPGVLLLAVEASADAWYSMALA
jgi:hypothetical protein